MCAWVLGLVGFVVYFFNLMIAAWGLGGQTSLLTVQFAYEACSRVSCLVLTPDQVSHDQPWLLHLGCCMAAPAVGWCPQQTGSTRREADGLT